MKYIHIAGTNGKGSVAEYISEIIMASGKSCACYTSPHLISHCERMRVDGKMIDEKTLQSLLEEVKQKGLGVNETLFAAYTAAAVLWFSRTDVEYAVMETGLGGRLDPTNHIKSDVTVLTPIDYDHENLLGASLTKIAQEKCGIIKRGVPVISAKQHKDVQELIAAHCKKNKSLVTFVEDVIHLPCVTGEQRFSYANEEYAIRSIGSCQPENAALAVRVALTLGQDIKSIKTGLKNAVLKCRTQYVGGNPNMIIDGAHNSSSIDMLVKTLSSRFADEKKVLLFACMKDKNYKAMISKLGNLFISAVITRVDENRGEDAEKLSKYLSSKTTCYIKEDIKEAFYKAKETAKKEKAMLVVCGSLYLAGAVTGFLNIKQ